MTIYSTLLFVLLLPYLLTGCDGPESVSVPPAQVPDVPTSPPGYLRLPLRGSITTIDPGMTMDIGSIELVEQLFLGLTDFDPETLEVVPEIATHWVVEEEGTVYRFYLRDDVFWTDGSPVTAHDIVWAIRRNIDPRTGSPMAYMLYDLKNARPIHDGRLQDTARIGVHAAGDREVVFTLEHAAAYFPALAGLWVYRPLPRELIEKHPDRWTEPERIRTNGSYRLEDWKRGERIVLSKNPDYSGADRVRIPEVHYLVVPESKLGMKMYEAGELDLLGGEYLPLPPAAIPHIRHHPVLGHEYRNEPQLCTYYYGFNTRRSPVDNPLVRKAIVAAIDRQLIIDVVAQEGQEPALTFTRPPILGAVDPEEGIGIGFDPEKARQWLAKAGYPEGRGFPSIGLLYDSLELHEKLARALQTLLRHHLNISVELVEKERDAYRDALAQPELPHLYKSTWCTDYPDANNWLYDVFHPTDSPNRIGWDNRAFAQQVEKAQKVTDPAARRGLYHRAERILVEEQAAILPLYFSTAGYLVKPRVINWHHTPIGGQHIQDWSLDNEADTSP